MSLPINRSQQSRLNGAKSKGPATPEGKARSSKNSLKHGRYADHAIVLANEDQAAFEDLAESYIRRIAPADSVEARYARDLAAIDWRLDRLRAIETRMLDHEMDTQPTPLLPTARRVPELTRLFQAANSLIKTSPLPAYLSNRENALLFARQATLSALQRLRRAHPLSEKCSQIHVAKPLKPELDPRNEPGTNPAPAQPPAIALATPD